MRDIARTKETIFPTYLEKIPSTGPVVKNVQDQLHSKARLKFERHVE